MRIYTYKQLYKPGKVITSVHKKEERNINFLTIIPPYAFKSNQFFDLKSKKTLVKLVKSINLCQFFNFLLHITVKSCHVLRFNYLEICYFLVYLLISGFPIEGREGEEPPLIFQFFFKNLPHLISRSSRPYLEHLWETLHM